ncbi:hypothetical protein LINGRAHAP2_LOCUS33594, partial [Linum grandiflorum]
HPLEALIRDVNVICLKDKGWCVIKHTRREANFVADGLAKLGHEEKNGERWFTSPPDSILNLLEADKRGQRYHRGAKSSSTEENGRTGVG